MGEAEEPQFLRVRHWERYQVFKDGRPMKFAAIWAVSDKNHTGIFDDPTFLKLANDKTCPVFRLMAYAAVTGNRIPNDPDFLKAKLYTDRRPNLQRMIDHGFLEPHPEAEEQIRTDLYEAEQICTQTDTETGTDTDSSPTEGTEGFKPAAAILKIDESKAHHIQRLLDSITDGDDRTPTQIKRLCSKVPIAVIERVREQIVEGRANSPARYAHAELKRESEARTA